MTSSRCAFRECSISCDSFVQRESSSLVQQRVWQSQSSSENPLRRRVPAVIDGRVAGPSDSGGKPSHTVQLFRHKHDAELVKQSSRMCLPDPSMPLTDCVLLRSDCCCRHEFAPQVLELLSELALEFSSLVVNQSSRYVRRSDPVFEEVVTHDLWMLAGNHVNNTQSACEVKNVHEAQLVAFIIRENKQVNGWRVTELSVCAKSRWQVGSRMLLTLAHIASQLKFCANCSCAATSDTHGTCKCMVRGMSQVRVHFGEDLQSIFAPPRLRDQAQADLWVGLELS